ncbi:MAG: hypothetical protein ACYTEQ_29150 [Planctomycetota bacterium]|jgi:hypothetical protein
MKTVLFLGAGATRAQWEWERTHGALRSDVGKDYVPYVRPPVGLDFVGLAESLCRCDFPAVRSYCGGATISGVEDLFTSIYEGALISGNDQLAKKAWHHLLVCYRKLIGCSTTPLTFPSGSPLPTLVRALRKSHALSSVVTTNQEFAAEFSLLNGLDEGNGVAWDKTSNSAIMCGQRAQIIKGTRHHYVFDSGENQDRARHLYGLRFQAEQIRRKNNRTISLRQMPFDSLPLPILKIHGSLNWWYPSKSEFDPSPKWPCRRPFLMTDADIPVFAGVKWDNPPEPHLYPLIVPFVKQKAAFFRDVLKPVLESAQRELDQCERLVVFGYGFSRSDDEAQNLFRSARSVRDAFVVDCREDAASRLRGLLGKRSQIKWRNRVEAILPCLRTE